MPTLYPFAQKGPASLGSEGAGSHYMNQPNDGSRIAIQGVGNGPMTMAATTATVVPSPVGIPSAAGGLPLTTPESAIKVSFITPSMVGGIRVCEVNASFVTYFLIPPSTVFGPIDIANCANLYLQSAAGTIATISFYYNLV